jgi:hypothetical protein
MPGEEMGARAEMCELSELSELSTGLLPVPRPLPPSRQVPVFQPIHLSPDKVQDLFRGWTGAVGSQFPSKNARKAR